MDKHFSWIIPVVGAVLIALFGWVAWIAHDYGQTKTTVELEIRRIDRDVENLRQFCCPDPADVRRVQPRRDKEPRYDQRLRYFED